MKRRLFGVMTVLMAIPVVFAQAQDGEAEGDIFDLPGKPCTKVQATHVENAQSYSSESYDAEIGDAFGDSSASDYSLDEEELFSTMSENESSVSAEAPVGAANITNSVSELMIARPNPFGYRSDPDNHWLAAIFHSYYYALSLLQNKISVIPHEEMARQLPDALDYSKRISKNDYLAAARRSAATHVLYAEYEPAGKEMIVHTSLITVADNSELQWKTALDQKEPQASLAQSGMEFFNKLSLMGVEKKHPALFSDLLRGAKRDFKTIAKNCAATNESKEALAEKAENCENIGQGAMPLSRYSAMQLYALAGRFREASRVSENIADEHSGNAGMLHLYTSALMRKAGTPERATSEIAAAVAIATEPIFVRREKGILFAQLGDFEAATSLLHGLVDEGYATHRIYRALALIAIAREDELTAKHNVKMASQRSDAALHELFASIGKEFENRFQSRHALTAYQMSLAADPTYDTALIRLGELYLRGFDKAKAAESFLKLYSVNNTKYRSYADRAAAIYEELEQWDNAREVYKSILERRMGDPRASVALARLELKDENCTQVRSLIDGLPSPWESDTLVLSMKRQCPMEGERNLTVQLSPQEEKQRRSRIRRDRLATALRLGAGVIAASAFAGGMVMNFRIPALQEEYDAATEKKAVDRGHDNLVEAADYRDKLYMAAGGMALVFGATITIPIIAR